MSFLSTARDVLNERANFSIVQQRRKWFAISGIAVAVSLGSLLVRDLNLGIEFKGGRAWQVTMAQGHPSVSAVRDRLAPLGLAEARISVLGGDTLRVQAHIEGERTADEAASDPVRETLAKYAGVKSGEVSSDVVGPTFGGEVGNKALRALLFFLAAVVVYLALRFELKMAGAAFVALAHDMAISVGV